MDDLLTDNSPVNSPREKNGYKNSWASKLMRFCFRLVRLEKLYEKYEDIWLYCFFGALTTLLAILSQYAMAAVIGDETHLTVTVATVFSWVCAVTFAYLTNRKYVFDSTASTKKEYITECFNFYVGRLATLGIELAVMNYFSVVLEYDSKIVKIIVQFVIMALNYVISKLFVFKKRASHADKK